MKCLSFLFFLILSTPLFADTASVELQAKLNAMRSLTANFKQVVHTGHNNSESTGLMALQRPGRFRWETKIPMEQLVVADGHKLWIYDVDLEQVTVKGQDHNVSETAALFLSGVDETVARDFKVTMLTEGDKTIYDLHPKSNKSNFQRLKLIFKQGTLMGLEMYDQLGQHTIVTLSEVRLNPSVSANLFQFKPPKGTDVVEQ